MAGAPENSLHIPDLQRRVVAEMWSTNSMLWWSIQNVFEFIQKAECISVDLS